MHKIDVRIAVWDNQDDGILRNETQRTTPGDLSKDFEFFPTTEWSNLTSFFSAMRKKRLDPPTKRNFLKSHIWFQASRCWTGCFPDRRQTLWMRSMNWRRLGYVFGSSTRLKSFRSSANWPFERQLSRERMHSKLVVVRCQIILFFNLVSSSTRAFHMDSIDRDWSGCGRQF